MEDVAKAIEEHMSEARTARGTGDLVAATAAMNAAWILAEELPDEHPLPAVVGWRRVKLSFDQSDMDGMVEAVEAVTQLLHPFDPGSPALRGAEAVARTLWDARGYGLPCIERMWTAYIAVWRGAGDPWMAANGETQLAWEWACSGRLESLAAHLEALACLEPRSFGNGPSRHPKAPDAPTSVWFAQMDVSRIALQAAVWGHDEDLARVAAELYADALADAELDEASDLWFLEAVGRAECAFDWPRRLAPRWLLTAAGAPHARASFHGALAAACVEPSDATIASLVERLGEADGCGPEWGVDARIVAARQGDRFGVGEPHALLEEARSRVDRYGLGVFHRSGAGLGPR